MKILWFSNANLSKTCRGTGSWLHSMSSLLVQDPNYSLINITQEKHINKIEKIEISSSLIQYLLPYYTLHNGLPSQKYIGEIQRIVMEESPTIIHVWGTEAYWGLLTARGYLKGNILLEMQGIISTCYKAYYANLSPSQILKCFSLKELILPTRFLPILRRNFKNRIPLEDEIIKSHRNIAVQSNWVENYIKLFAPTSFIFHSLIPVRSEFLKSCWKKEIDLSHVELVTISSEIPYKGLLDVIYVIGILKKDFPNIKLKVIGSFNKSSSSIRLSGYGHLVWNTIKKLDLLDNIIFCGSLDSLKMVKVLSDSDIYIQSSYVESYSLAVAEAMAFGIPCVVSYAGAMPELGKDGESMLFYTPGDIYMCAGCIMNLLHNKDLVQLCSTNARILGTKRNNLALSVERQKNIYKSLLNRR